jgi:hypothetical protein
MPFVAIKQTSFDFLKNHCMIPQYRSALNFIFGSLSGVVGTVALYPTYMFKRIMQANNSKDFNIFRHGADLYRRKGITGFYNGMSMTIVKVIPYQGIMFWCNEKLKVILKYETHK